jgi:hypothetical protein
VPDGFVQFHVSEVAFDERSSRPVGAFSKDHPETIELAFDSPPRVATSTYAQYSLPGKSPVSVWVDRTPPRSSAWADKQVAPADQSNLSSRMLPGGFVQFHVSESLVASMIVRAEAGRASVAVKSALESAEPPVWFQACTAKQYSVADVRFVKVHPFVAFPTEVTFVKVHPPIPR